MQKNIRAQGIVGKERFVAVGISAQGLKGHWTIGKKIFLFEFLTISKE